MLITPDPPTEAPEHGVPCAEFDHHRATYVVRCHPRYNEDSDFGSDDIPASAYAGAAGAVTAGSAVANPVGHSAELDYTGPELAHSAELDYAGGDDLPELLPREAAQAPAPRGFARPGDLSAGGGVV